MNTTLSKREKKMLYVLLCFLILVGGFFLAVSPSLKAYDSAKEQLQEVQMQKSVMEKTIKAYPETLAALNTSKERLREQQQAFFKIMTNEELDKELQKITAKFGLQTVSLSMSDIEEQDVQEFIPLSADATKKATTQKAQVNTVTMQLNGTGTAFINLLEDLSNRTALRITNMQMEANKLTQVQTFTLNMDVYMMDYIA